MIPTRYNVALVSIVFVIGLAELCAPLTADAPQASCASSSWSPLGPWQPAEIGTEKTYRYRVLGGDTPPCAMEVETLTRDTATGAVTATLSPLPAVAQTPQAQPLVQASHLAEAGCIRFPSWQGDNQSFNYGGTALAFDATRQSIWAVGHDHHDPIVEISIPSPGPCANIGALPRATVRSPYLQTPWRSQVGSGEPVDIGGLWPAADGSLLVSAYINYDANNNQVASHFRLSPTRQVSGPFRMDTSQSVVAPNRAGSVSGWMIPIPPEWQALFGGPALAGNCCRNIITRTSWGPALSVFNPAQVGSTAAPITELLGYTQEHATLGGCVSQGTRFNCTSRINGGVFVAGTRSILFFQKIGTGPVSYSAGYFGPPYKTQVLAYDANDLLAVKNGQREPYEVVPYAVWDLPWSQTAVNNANVIQGAAYDPATNRIYLSVSEQDGEMPLMRVWQVAIGGGGTTPPPPTEICGDGIDNDGDGLIDEGCTAPPTQDTVSPVVSLTLSSTAVAVGDTVRLSATATDNVGVTRVEFRQDGVIQATLTAPPYEHDWIAPSVGTFTNFRALAWDAAGNPPGVSTLQTVTVTDATVPPPPPPPPPPIDPCVADPVRLSVGAWPVHVSGRQTQMRYTVTTSAVSWRLTDVRPERIEVTDSRGCTAAVAR